MELFLLEPNQVYQKVSSFHASKKDVENTMDKNKFLKLLLTVFYTLSKVFIFSTLILMIEENLLIVHVTMQMNDILY